MKLFKFSKMLEFFVLQTSKPLLAIVDEVSKQLTLEEADRCSLIARVR